MDERQSLWCFKICNGIANIESFNSYNGTKVSRQYFSHLPLAHAFKHVQFFYALLFNHTISLHQTNGLVFLDRTPGHLSNGNTAKK